MKRVPLPASLVWELSARCPLACEHCYNIWTAPGGTLPTELSTAELEQVLDNIATATQSLTALTFSGGEPLLRKDLLTIIASAKLKLPKTQLSLATSGVMFDKEKAQAVKDAGISVVQFSLLAANAKEHDELVKMSGAFERTLGSIAHAKATGLLVAVFFVATRSNITEFPGTAKLALAIGADTVVFNRVQPGGRGISGWQERTPTPAQLAEALVHFESLNKQIGISMGTILPPCELDPAAQKPKDIVSCPIGTKNAYPTIGPDGSLRPCNHSPKVAGNLLEQSFADLLQSPCMKATATANIPAECQDCKHAKSCRGGCLAARDLAGKAIYDCFR